jgi:hypothetical protein
MQFSKGSLQGSASFDVIVFVFHVCESLISNDTANWIHSTFDLMRQFLLLAFDHFYARGLS